jgi:hypothetical protein
MCQRTNRPLLGGGERKSGYRVRVGHIARGNGYVVAARSQRLSRPLESLRVPVGQQQSMPFAKAPGHSETEPAGPHHDRER